MRIVIITAEGFIPCESETIARLAELPDVRIHLRKPGATPEQLRQLIERIPPSAYARISLHDHHRLAVEYGLGGVHRNGRNPLPPEGWEGLRSRSCHSIDELARCTEEDYRFLSPIYDSLSKTGYTAAFGERELAAAAAAGILDARTVALGGVTPERLPELARRGFGGAAFLGYVWSDPDPQSIRKRIDKILCYNSSLTKTSDMTR